LVVAAVMVAAFASFKDTDCHQTNTLVYGPGGYSLAIFCASACR
jgi:di/tricarboxylate transporter